MTPDSRKTMINILGWTLFVGGTGLALTIAFAVIGAFIRVVLEIR